MKVSYRAVMLSPTTPLNWQLPYRPGLVEWAVVLTSLVPLTSG